MSDLSHARSEAPAGRPLRFAIWPVAVDIVRAGLDRFARQSRQPVALDVVQGEYGAAMDAILGSGEQPVDLFYAQRGEAARWYEAGHVRPIDDLPGLEALQARMMPQIRRDCRHADGRCIGLTYYNGGPFCLFRNQALLDRAGYPATGIAGDYPQTWEEVRDQARALKRRGLCEHPILMHWHGAPTGLPWALLAQCFSEGETFVDEAGEVRFGLDTPILKVLSDWRQWVEEGLVDASSVSFDERALHDSWLSGRHAFHPHIDYKTSLYNDAAAGGAWTHQNAVMPGLTQDTVLVGHAMLCVGARTATAREASDLLRFLGGTDATGALWMHRQWVLRMNMAVPYPEIYDDPACKAAILARLYPPRAEEELRFLIAGRARAKAPALLRAGWYKAWERQAHCLIRDELILDRTASPTDVVCRLRSLAEKLSRTAVQEPGSA